MADTSGFAKFVPGFDFLQGLVANAGTALPNMGQWIVPTLDPAELDKRIDELRTVQFWLDQNSRMLSATIQALEVQRMTLSTLKGMNLSMGDLQSGLHAKAPAKPPAANPFSPPPAPAAAAPAADAAPGAAEPAAGVVDPMQWWGSLTEQFSKLAADAMRNAAEAVPPVSSTGPRPAPAKPAAGTPAAAPAAARKAKPAAKAAPASERKS